jgi:hypothetical protein
VLIKEWGRVQVGVKKVGLRWGGRNIGEVGLAKGPLVHHYCSTACTPPTWIKMYLDPRTVKHLLFV